MNIPEGYVLVPINATSAMIEYGKYERMQCLANPSLSVQGALVRIYGAMVSAAPPVELAAYDEAKERELFEVYAKTVNQSVNLKIYTVEEGRKGVFVNYKDIGVQASWMTWKSCAKSRARSAE